MDTDTPRKPAHTNTEGLPEAVSLLTGFSLEELDELGGFYDPPC